MTAPALITPESTRRALSRCHAPRNEYFDWVRDVFAGTPSSIKSRRYFYNRFVRHWPNLEDWFAAPLLVRLDLHDRDQWQTGKRMGPSHEAGTYLTYLSLVHGLPMEADWLLSRNFDSMFHPRVAAGLGLDLALLDCWVERMTRLGYKPAYARSAVTWSLARLTLRRGDPDFTTITADDIRALGEELRSYCARPEAGFIRATHVSNARRHDDMDKLATQFAKSCASRLYTFHVLLFNLEQVVEKPIFGLRRQEKWKDQLVPLGTPPAIGATIERWLNLRLQSTDRAASMRHARDAFRYLVRWLTTKHPEITNLDQVNRGHIEDYLVHLHEHINPRNNKPLSPRTRYTYLSPLAQFFRDTAQWGWSNVPGRPLLGPSDFPKLPARLPRFIPRDELDRLMEVIEALDDPFQRTALLLLRWSGARRGEIARLTLDCLDAYPDGYPRLRIPVGKTYAERMIPLHPQAADALRELIEHRRSAPAAAHHDRWAGRHVHWVFIHRGKPIGRRYLFEDALETACTRAGLVDADGKPTITAHRFRHTVGTQLAEGGARIQTIMAILGHRSAGMAVTYSHISDPVLKEQYERVIANGDRVAGPAAEALLNNEIGQDTLDWLKSNYFKTELELGHCLRLPAEGPCECDLYLRCSKFFTTSEYAPRLRERLGREQQLIQDATERNWPREIERHEAISRRIRELLADLGEPCKQPDGESE
jgi:integrase